MDLDEGAAAGVAMERQDPVLHEQLSGKVFYTLPQLNAHQCRQAPMVMRRAWWSRLSVAWMTAGEHSNKSVMDNLATSSLELDLFQPIDRLFNHCPVSDCCKLSVSERCLSRRVTLAATKTLGHAYLQTADL